MLVRTSGDPRSALPAIRGIMRQVDGEQALTRIQTLEERVAEATAPRRFVLWLVGLFSAIAVGLALIGIYAVVAESVAQRVPEIGVRMALGASTASVMGLVLRQGAWMVVMGIAAGGVMAVAFNKLMAGFVFRVATTDPVAYAAAVLCLAAVALAACAIPARRAARIDPVLALRAQ
jgi:putative ABC transport system permease protein